MKEFSVGKKSLYVLVMLGAAFIIVLIASATTSPLYPYYKGWDSGMYQLIGKEWGRGHIPYTELFDQKGPVIFFINMLGYTIAGNKYGVFCIQVLSMFFTEFVVFELFSKLFSPRNSLIISNALLLPFICSYEFGNLCEEYVNPLILLSLCGYVAWLEEKNKGSKEHKPLYAFIYGITFGFSMMTRLTNSIAICVIVFFICIYLLANKKFNNFFANALAFICGAALLILPFTVYFALKGSSYDFWYGTIIYNFAYASASSGSVMTIIRGAGRQIGSYALIMLGIIFMCDKKYFDGSVYIAIGAATEFLLANINNFGHYAMITYPYFVIAVYELTKLYMHSEKGQGFQSVKKRVTGLVLLAVLLITVVFTSKELIKLYRHHEKFASGTSAETIKYDQLIEFVENIPAEDRNSVIGYGTNPCFYLDMGITPVNRFFTFQDWMASYSDNYTELLFQEYEINKPKWIVLVKNGDVVIQKILDTFYSVVMTEPVEYSNGTEELILYKLD